ncbi:spore germination protein [Paenibacillus sp. YIM B09110]|uniref:spore germination protein n=1 Tax=Paenibacillus sp. YIM B09110 TaxID=3126102 RepID=UPI00301E0619
MNTSGQGQQVAAFTGNLTEDEAMLRKAFINCSDIVFHMFITSMSTPALCVYCQGLCDTDRLERQVLMPLIIDPAFNALLNNLDVSGGTILPSPSNVPFSSMHLVGKVNEAVQAILEGNAFLIVEGKSAGSIYSMSKVSVRAPEEPAAESTIRGARDGFTESLEMNLSLLRKRMKTPALKIKSFKKGEFTGTQIAFLFIEGVVDPSLLREVEARLEKLKLNDVLESKYIEEGIIDQRFSPFPQMLATERPDVVAANLLEGRFALVIDGTPFSLIAPVNLFTMLQSPEDYYQNIYMSLFIRWMRYFFYVLSLLLPSAYVAITTFHQEMIPTVLLLSIARAREEIPFPALVEALIMEISFEALREAGVRLPKQIGSAVSIVGALIIGQAATSAGIVSAPMIIVVAMTGIASFMIPRYSTSVVTRLLRFPIMILAGTLGLTGIMLGFILIVIHLSSLRSFGTPYLSPAAPTSSEGLKDIWGRSLSWKKRG